MQRVAEQGCSYTISPLGKLIQAHTRVKNIDTHTIKNILEFTKFLHHSDGSHSQTLIQSIKNLQKYKHKHHFR